MKTLPLLLLCLGLVACAADVEVGLTKQEVRNMAPGDRDYCEEFDWYGDGECDSFCSNPDSDCGGCITTGCSGQICAREEVASTCEFLPEYACYQELGTCEEQADGVCGWTDTPELSACLNPTPEPAACRPTGCSGQICADEDVVTTCEFLPEYACYDGAECARQDDGACGWTETTELLECLGDPTPEPDTCRATGCSGQICASEDVASTCEFLPEYACYQEHGVCEAQGDGECAWTSTPELNMCLENPGA